MSASTTKILMLLLFTGSLVSAGGIKKFFKKKYEKESKITRQNAIKLSKEEREALIMKELKLSEKKISRQNAIKLSKEERDALIMKELKLSEEEKNTEQEYEDQHKIKKYEVQHKMTLNARKKDTYKNSAKPLDNKNAVKELIEMKRYKTAEEDVFYDMEKTQAEDSADWIDSTKEKENVSTPKKNVSTQKLHFKRKKKNVSKKNGIEMKRYKTAEEDEVFYDMENQAEDSADWIDSTPEKKKKNVSRPVKKKNVSKKKV